MEMETSVEEHHKKGRQRKKQLYNSILQQMEFYMSDSNLAKDRFLSQLLTEGEYIDLEVFLKCNKLRKITTSLTDLVKALKKSTSLELSDDETKVKRKTPVQFKENADDCTIYVQNIKSDTTHEWLKYVFSEFGNVVYVSIPKYKRNNLNKGFAFIEFEQEQEAKKVGEYFESISGKISSQMDPAQLCSIATFEKDGEEIRETSSKKGSEENKETSSKKRNEENKETSEENQDEESKETSSKNRKKQKDVEGGEDTNKKKIKQEAIDYDLEDDSKKPAKKIKIEGEIKKPMDEVNGKKIKVEEDENTNKRKAEENPIIEVNVKKIKTEDDLDDESKKKKADDSDGDEKTNEERTDDEKKKKKKLNKRKKEIKEFGIQILTKKEWKAMRNRYLNMQKSKMKELKRHLNRKRFGNKFEDRHKMEVEQEAAVPKAEKLDYTPGVIIKLKLKESYSEAKKIKNEVKTLHPDIQYVDVPVTLSNDEVFLRFSSDENAKNFAKTTDKGESRILEGDEEKDYWAKIQQSKEKIMKKDNRRQRGRDKLLKKAERELGKHIRFDDED